MNVVLLLALMLLLTLMVLLALMLLLTLMVLFTPVGLLALWLPVFVAVLMLAVTRRWPWQALPCMVRRAGPDDPE